MVGTTTSGRRGWMAGAFIAIVLSLGLGLTGTASAEFGIQSFDGEVSNQDGSAYTQAGGHPWSASTTIVFNQHLASGVLPTPDEDTKTLVVDLPAGFIGNPSAIPKCSEQVLADTGRCPVNTQVGTSLLTAGFIFINTPLLIYNMEPPPGVPASFAFVVAGVVVHLNARVRSDDDYGVTLEVSNTPQTLPLLNTSVTFWGVPADSSHDGQRGFNDNGDMCAAVGSCSNPAGVPRTALLTNPTACTPAGVGLKTTLSVDSWQHPGVFRSASFFSHLPAPDQATQQGPTGCDDVPFDASLSATPESAEAGAPSGFAFALTTPQSDNPDAIANALLRKAVVQLPQGVTVSPSAADGLAGCSPGQVGLKSLADATCPDGSKVGTVQIDTPLLEQPMSGSIYLAKQTDNPFGTLLALYLVAKGPGVIVKLPGKVETDPVSGQLTATFDNNPQLPFETLHLQFTGGPRATLVNPKTCGTFTTHAVLTSWASDIPVNSDSSFTIDKGCDQAAKFEPSLRAGVTDPRAGGSSPFTLTLSRPSGQQDIAGLDVTLPPGVLGNVSSVSLCPEAQAAAGTCSGASQVGRVTVLAGAGTSPLAVPQAGKAPTAVYLAGPYKGAPYSLSIVVPAQAGPFDLGTVVVRAALLIDPVDAHVTVHSDPIPTILQGIPLDVQKINVTIDRPGFMVSPTNCEPMQVAGRVSSAQGVVADVASRFQVGECASLDLEPKLAIGLTGKGQTTDNKHPGVVATLAMPAGQANLKKVTVTLPLSLALDPDNAQSDTLCEFVAGQKTIPDCPQSSIVGTATARTPLLAEPLTGPVYFVKNVRIDAKTGRQIKTLPALAIPLQGNGVTLVLRATSAVVDDHLVTTFDRIPDAPVSDFKLTINGGKKGILVVSDADVCKATQVAEQVATGQNGKVADAAITLGTPCALGVVASSHTATALKVTVGGVGAGKVTVSGKGLTKSTRTITTATTATLQPRLSKAARSALAHGRNVKIRVTVAFTPKGTKKAKTTHKTITIHGAKKAKKR